METSSFLFENLPYSILLWLHFGTGLLISYGYVFYVFPILYNIVVMVLPKFKFGFGKQATEEDGSGSTVIPADLKKTLNDSKIFAHAYSRNPKLFSMLPKEEVSTFFSGLDNKLSNISTVLKGFPEAEPNPTDDIKGPDINPDDANLDSENISDNKDKEEKNKKSIEKKSSKSSVRNLLLYGNLVFLVAIIGINVYGYIQYSSLFSEYYIVKKGLLKYSDNNYELDVKKISKLKDTTKLKILQEMHSYVQMINSVKTDKLRREKLEELEKQRKNKK